MVVRSWTSYKWGDVSLRFATAWCVAIGLAGYLWARTVFNCGPAR
jgi:hypothetical protein